MMKQDVIQFKIRANSWEGSRQVDCIGIEVSMPNRMGIRLHDIPRGAFESPEGLAALITLLSEEFKADLKLYIDNYLKNGIER